MEPMARKLVFSGEFEPENSSTEKKFNSNILKNYG